MKVKQGSIGGVDSMQHMLHYMSHYNNRTLGTKEEHTRCGQEPAAGAQLNGGVNKGKGES
jgi:hypothetical protein